MLSCLVYNILDVWVPCPWLYLRRYFVQITFEILFTFVTVNQQTADLEKHVNSLE